MATAKAELFTEYFFNSPKHNKKIFCVSFEPTTEEKLGLVLIVHGYAEHCGPYYELAKILQEKGFCVLMQDHYGHGKSEGDRVLIDSVDTYVEDILYNLDTFKKSHPVTPIFMVGHSMGGTIAIKAGLARPEEFAGIVLAAPAVIADPDLAKPWKIKVAKLLGRFIPSLPIASLEPKLLSRDEARLEEILNDDYRFHGMSKAGWGLAMLAAFEEIKQRFEEIKWPVLIIHGEQDKICALEGSHQLIKECVSQDKELKVYPDTYHGLFVEIEDVRKLLHNDITDWLLKRAKP